MICLHTAASAFTALACPHRGWPAHPQCCRNNGTAQGSLCSSCSGAMSLSCCRAAVSWLLSVFGPACLSLVQFLRRTKLPQFTSHLSFHLFFLVSFASAPFFVKFITIPLSHDDGDDNGSNYHVLILLLIARGCAKHFTYIVSSAPLRIHTVLSHLVNENPRPCEVNNLPKATQLLSFTKSQNAGGNLCISRIFIVCVCVCVTEGD